MNAIRSAPLTRYFPKSFGGVLAGLIALILFFSWQSPVFFDANNFLNIGRQIALLAVGSFAMTLIILSGEIDLSIGAVVALIGIFIAIIMRWEDYPQLAGFMTATGLGSIPIVVAVLVALAAGALIGFINGFITVKMHVPSFIVTLAMFSAARGISFAITQQRAISIFNDDYLLLFADAQPLGIAVSIWYTVVILAALHFMLTRTRFGAAIYAVGGNRQAARYSGLAVDRIKIGVFVLAGVLLGLAAVFQTARIGTGFAEGARNLELDAIAAVVIGGTSFTGGRGSVLQTVLGVLLIGILNNGLTLMNVDAYLQLVIKGIIIVAAVLFDRWSR
jgi:ribose transport system permease protein